MNAFGKTHYLLLAAAAVVAGLGLYMLSTGLETSTALIGAPMSAVEDSSPVESM